MEYNLRAIFELIKQALTLTEFDNLVFCDFRCVWEQFAPGQDLDSRIRILLDYADKHQEIDKILQEIKQVNPKSFADFLQKQKEELEAKIAELESSDNKCNQSLNELYNKLNYIEEKIEQLSSHPLPNPKTIEKYLPYIDFEKALETFEKIQSQFNQDGDVALFFMEESLSKRGDLCLQRLRNDLTDNSCRQPFRYCPVTYTSGNLEAVTQGIANFFGVKREEVTIELVIQKIGDSLQNNSVLFLEITCNISDPSEIVPLIPWFINDFWQPLRAKINEVTRDYEGIKVIAVIISDFNLEQRLLEDDLFCYCNNETNYFVRDRLVKIILENWTQDNISNWLRNVNPSLRRGERNIIASTIYNTTQGHPNDVCFALQRRWQTLINSTASC